MTNNRKEIPIKTPYIKLDAFLKLAGACGTGGEAKKLVQQGGVLLNGSLCVQRGKKLVLGDEISLERQKEMIFIVG